MLWEDDKISDNTNKDLNNIDNFANNNYLSNLVDLVIKEEESSYNLLDYLQEILNLIRNNSDYDANIFNNVEFYRYLIDLIHGDKMVNEDTNECIDVVFEIVKELWKAPGNDMWYISNEFISLVINILQDTYTRREQILLSGFVELSKSKAIKRVLVDSFEFLGFIRSFMCRDENNGEENLFYCFKIVYNMIDNSIDEIHFLQFIPLLKLCISSSKFSHKIRNLCLMITYQYFNFPKLKEELINQNIMDDLVKSAVFEQLGDDDVYFRIIGILVEDGYEECFIHSNILTKQSFFLLSPLSEKTPKVLDLIYFFSDAKYYSSLEKFFIYETILNKISKGSHIFKIKCLAILYKYLYYHNGDVERLFSAIFLNREFDYTSVLFSSDISALNEQDKLYAVGVFKKLLCIRSINQDNILYLMEKHDLFTTLDSADFQQDESLEGEINTLRSIVSTLKGK